MGLVVYGEFADPHCQLASLRVDALRAAGVPVDWRAVEARPHIPVSGLRDTTDLARQRAEVTALLVAGEQLPGAVPAFLPRTEAAVAAYAEACGAGVADDVRRLLFALYWEHGVDIGAPNAIRTALTGPILRGHSDADPLCRSGYAVSVDRGPITTGAWRRIADWRAGWQALGSRALPALLDDSGLTLTGDLALQRLAKEIGYAGASLAPVLPDPARYPEPALRPPQGWATAIGGSWRYAGRPGGR